MLVKEESESDYKTLDFQGIADFIYEKGYEYAFWVEKRTLVDPPADGSSIVYKLIDVISKAKVEYEYTIKVDGPNPFILSPEGGEYEIPFTCKAKKFAEGNLVEDGYIPLKGLRYNMGTFVNRMKYRRITTTGQIREKKKERRQTIYVWLIVIVIMAILTGVGYLATPSTSLLQQTAFRGISYRPLTALVMLFTANHWLCCL